MSDKERVENLQAREELEKRGYVWIQCDQCHGTGMIHRHTVIQHLGIGPCYWCDAKGGKWKAPMTR